MKTSNKLLLSLLIVALIAVTAFIGTAKHYHQRGSAVKGDSNRATEARNVSEYSGIKLRGKIEVRLTQGPARKVEVQAAKNIVPLVSTQVTEGILMIETTSRIDEDEKIEVIITAPAIQSLEMTEGSYIESTNALTGDKLNINSNSGSNGRLKLQYKNVECEVSTGSVFDLDGSSEEASLKASTGARLDAGDFLTKTCMVEASTGANTSVNVSQVLTAEISTGSELNYRGDPAKTTINANSGGIAHKQ
jgi:hypothetical protein